MRTGEDGILSEIFRVIFWIPFNKMLRQPWDISPIDKPVSTSDFLKTGGPSAADQLLEGTTSSPRFQNPFIPNR